MLARADIKHPPRSRVRQAEEREFRVLLAIGFVFFLVAITLRRAMPWNWGRRGDHPSPRTSIFAEAHRAAHTAIPLAFGG